MPVELLGKSAEELRAFAASLGERPFRGAQLYHALYAERRFELSAMTNLPAALREHLASAGGGRITPPRILRRFPSADGSIRYLFSIGGPAGDENVKPAQIEAVFMPREGRQTICISTQAGCAVDCHFCLTAQLGLIRNLTAGEIVGQVLVALEENREQLAPRHVTLSTSGIVPGIERLGQEKIRPSLAISLNASSDEQRNALMPINRKYPLDVLLDACRRYPLRPREYFTFEYVLLGGVNDTPEDSRRVVRLISQIRAKVNLIPWNPGNLPYRAPAAESIEEFQRILVDKGVPTFVRYSRGQDVFAACGQLALMETPSPFVALR